MSAKKIYLIITTPLFVHDLLVPRLQEALSAYPNLKVTVGGLPEKMGRLPFGPIPVKFTLFEHVTREMTLVTEAGHRDEDQTVFHPFVNSSPHADAVHIAVGGPIHSGKTVIMSAIEHELMRPKEGSFTTHSVAHASLDFGMGALPEDTVKRAFGNLPETEVVILCPRPRSNTTLRSLLARCPETQSA